MGCKQEEEASIQGLRKNEPIFFFHFLKQIKSILLIKSALTFLKSGSVKFFPTLDSIRFIIVNANS